LNLTFLSFLFINVFAYGQSGCNDLEITSVQEGSVCGEGRVTLSATPSGSGDKMAWFESDDTANDTIPVHMGAEYITPHLSSTTDYWVSEIIEVGSSGAGGGLLPEMLYYKFDEGSSITNHATNPVGDNPASIVGSDLVVGSSGLVG